MHDISTLTVGLGTRAYDISVGRGLIVRADDLIGAFLNDRHVVVISDSNVAPFHLPAIMTACKRVSRRCNTIEVPAGESSKSMPVLAKLLEDILALGVDRGVVLIALGGGVIGDLVGFAAASLLRGVDFIQVPTTLLAQVDSSVGGKTGVNAAAGKNLIGAFHQPRAVLADLAALDTLADRELRAGYAEVVKYGLLGDAAFFEWLEAHGDSVLARDDASLRHAVERESGKRALLNLGHTFAHALEAVCGYDGRLLHGEAVGTGMALAYDLATEMQICSGQDCGRVHAHIAASGLITRLGDSPAAHADTASLIDIMRRDKKVRDGRMHFVLPRAIGDSYVSDEVREDVLAAVLEASR